MLPEHKNLSYIPNQTIYDDPRFLVTELSSKEVKLASQNAPNGDGTISWLYNFVTAGASPVDLLAGTEAAGKAWVLDSAVQGHVGCGWDAENAAGWWAAGPEEKAGFGMYDDVVTFFPDGKYKYDTGADGKMYVNKEVTKVGPGGASEDYDVEYAGIEATYKFDGEKIVLPEGTPMVYVSSDAIWDSPEFFVTELTETTLKVVTFKQTVGNPDGIAWQMIFKARDIKAPAGPTLNGQELPATLSVSQGEVLTVGNLNLADIWVDPDFFEVAGADLKFKAVAGDYQFQYDKSAKWIKVVPMSGDARATYENGKALWIIGTGGGKPTAANAVGWNTGEAPLPMARIAENKYQITLATVGGTESVKIFGQSDWGIEWKHDGYASFNADGLFKLGDGTGGDKNDDGNIYHTDSEPGYYVFTVVDNDGILDMTVTKMAQTVWDATAESNLWLTANQSNMEFYSAITDSWTANANPEYEAEGNHYTLTFPAEVGALQWQCQVKYKTLGFATTSEKNYDFQVKVLSEEDHPGITIKLVKEGDDNTFYCADRHVVKAGEEYVYRLDNVPGIDMEDVQLVFDFAGAAGGSTLEYYDIIIQEHRAE